MRPGRELDCAIAQKIFGHRVFVKKHELFEETPKGDRPLRPYSKDITYAWEVVEKMSITLIPIENASWFALVGKPGRWESPATFLEYLQKGNFISAGAAVGEKAPQVICLAALKATETRDSISANSSLGENEGESPAASQVH